MDIEKEFEKSKSLIANEIIDLLPEVTTLHYLFYNDYNLLKYVFFYDKYNDVKIYNKKLNLADYYNYVIKNFKIFLKSIDRLVSIRFLKLVSFPESYFQCFIKYVSLNSNEEIISDVIIKDVYLYNNTYKTIDLGNNSILYCDKPNEKINKKSFYNWVCKQTSLVVVNSDEKLDERFKEVWSNPIVKERLYIPIHQMDLWNKYQKQQKKEK